VSSIAKKFQRCRKMLRYRSLRFAKRGLDLGDLNLVNDRRDQGVYKAIARHFSSHHKIARFGEVGGAIDVLSNELDEIVDFPPACAVHKPEARLSPELLCDVWNQVHWKLEEVVVKTPAQGVEGRFSENVAIPPTPGIERIKFQRDNVPEAITESVVDAFDLDGRSRLRISVSFRKFGQKSPRYQSVTNCVVS
ncbi:MAG TPA: hypothetical protein VGG51_14400, partial [Candidatus Cybelea sp.]